jgi:hypothetical protein
MHILTQWIDSRHIPEARAYALTTRVQGAFS